MKLSVFTLALLLTGSASASDISLQIRPPVAHPDQTEMAQKIGQLLEMRYLAQYHLNQFDLSLENSASGDIFSMPGYAELLETRAKIEVAEHEVVDAYLAARESNNLPVIAGVQESLAEIKGDGVKQYLMNDLFVELDAELAEKPLSPTELSLLAPLTGDTLVAAAVSNQARISSDLDALLRQESFQATVKNSRVKKEFFEQIAAVPGQNITGREFPAGVWAITYDDGPSGRTTPTIFQNLRTYGIPATFFWLAKNVAANPGVVGQGKDFEYANHSYSHAQLTKLGAAGLHKEIVTSTEIETKAYGYKPKFFRCPYGAGANNANIRKIIAGQGMVHVFWNVDSLDWQDKNPASIAARVRKQMAAQGRGVVLFHDIHSQTVSATKTLMQEWQAEKAAGKRRFLKMSDAVKLM